MHWTLHATLRPDADDQMQGRFQASTREAAHSLMDDWVSEHGQPGDRVSYVFDGPNAVGAGGPFGDFVVE